MRWELILYLVFLTGSGESQCSKQDYQHCVKLADPLLRDPHLIYPDNARDVEHVCRTWSFFVDCVKQYTERCFTESKRVEFNKAVETPVSSVHRLCSMPDYRVDFMKHASCMKMTLTQDDYCGRHYKLLVSQVSGEAPATSICCSHHLFRECVLDQTRNSCEADAEVFSAQVLDKALSFLKNQCTHYTPNQVDCPGSEFYRTGTPRADMSTTVTSRQMMVHLQEPPKHQNDPVEERPTTVHSPPMVGHNNWHQPSAPSRGSSTWSKQDWVTSWMPDDRGKTTEATGEASHNLGTVSAPPGSERTTFSRMDWDNKEGSSTDRVSSNNLGAPPIQEPPNTVNKGPNTDLNAQQSRPNSSGTDRPPSWKPYTPHNPWFPSSKANDYKESNAIDEPNQQGLGSNYPDNSHTRLIPGPIIMSLTLLFMYVAR